jgi:hypothetical protein
LARMRMVNQLLAGASKGTVKAVVVWMGAMQAQDFSMAKWAVGVRLPGVTEKEVEAAISNGEIIRMHLLRPTWHLVAAEDVRWLLALTAPRIKASLRSRHRELGLSKDIVAKSNKLMANALKGGNHMAREELLAVLDKAGIALVGNRASHLLLLAELDGIVCSGAMKKGRPTYTLLAERIPRSAPLGREEALARLAGRYFTSHGPATLKDYMWWSGLSASDAKRSLSMVQADFASRTIASRTYWFARFGRLSRMDKKKAWLLPAFDEFLIGYRDRSAALSAENLGKAVSNNGLFRPVVMIDGQIKGTWKSAADRNDVIVETSLFKRSGRVMSDTITIASAHYGDFLQRKVGMISISQRSSNWE